ncbi:MAG: 16S rRNA (cytosine(967)-C(5))-methyltransferase RsmB [Fidelibacterota bacterium]|nr:MAG: 16S rRNA (cytosine(967)-C(5))-methyltransferase RsmB [Candidatus Neomarinimicrobiota bacterium]
MIDETRRTAFKVLTKADRGSRINEVLHQVLAGSAHTQQERRFITELVLGSIRMQRRLDAELAACYDGRYNHMEWGVKQLLRMGAYQLRYMDSVPPHAALSTTVELAKAVDLARAAKLINGVLRELSRRAPSDDVSDDAPADELATAFSHPTWLVERWLKRWDRDRTAALMEWNNRRPVVWLRQRISAEHRERLANVAKEKGLTLVPHPLLPDYVTAEPSPASLLEAEVLNIGSFIVQDPASGAVVQAVEPQVGEVIIDLCAGPGGKTAAMAELVGTEGRILAYELDPGRVALINDTLVRLGLENVDLYPGDATAQSLPKADKILIDAPCTGTGVMARRTDLRWRRQPEQLAEMTNIQMSLLEHAARSLQSGGTLVYATCSLETEENWDLIHEFQSRHPQFFVVPMPEGVPRGWIDDLGALSTFPPDHQVDGIFAVRLKV